MRRTRAIKVKNVQIGGGAPVAVQSMTKTDTTDVEGTVAQIEEMMRAGCEIVRVAVPDKEAAVALKEIRRRVPDVPLVADIHFHYKLALAALDAGVDKLRLNPHQGALRIVVERKGERRELVTGTERTPEGKLGFGFGEGPLERVGISAALGYAIDMNIEIIRLTGKAVGQIFTGQRSARDTLSGPIGIARESSRAANELGWGGVFAMLGFLSLNLGIFNLLPIPVLDGGMIFMLFLEGALALVGLKLSMTIRERIQQVGFVFLLLLMSFVIINDITKLASRSSSSSQGNNQPAATSSPAK